MVLSQMNGTFLFFSNYIYVSFHSFSDALVSKLGSIHFLIKQKLEPTIYLMMCAVPSRLLH